jgi:hypothetical protein
VTSVETHMARQHAFTNAIEVSPQQIEDFKSVLAFLASYLVSHNPALAALAPEAVTFKGVRGLVREQNVSFDVFEALMKSGGEAPLTFEQVNEGMDGMLTPYVKDVNKALRQKISQAAAMIDISQGLTGAYALGYVHLREMLAVCGVAFDSYRRMLSELHTHRLVTSAVTVFW